MPFEIERKFLVARVPPLEGVPGVHIQQGYLNKGGVTTRVRVQADCAWLTLKGPPTENGRVRLECEYAIPLDDALALLALCDGRIVEKTRYRIPGQGVDWELDFYHGRLQGCVTAEAELISFDAPLVLPAWIGQEVTSDRRWSNESLAEFGTPNSNSDADTP